jgi:Co/Zn/Cd efflux system component
MMGDSAAMIVDSMTYLFNWIAERRKHRLDELVQNIKLKHERNDATNNILFNSDRCRKKLKLQMEIIPPVISLTTLTVVLIMVLDKSIQTLILSSEQSRRYLEKTPDLKLMIIFSSLNLFLDLFNVFCFARARHLLGWDVVDSDTLIDQEDSKDYDDDDEENVDDIVKNECRAEGDKLEDGDNRLDSLEQHGDRNSSDCEQGRTGYSTSHKDVEPPSSISNSFTKGKKAVDAEEGNLDGDGAPVPRRRRANLNMCSAYTHVFADTLRSSAVIIAAVVAILVPTISPEEADATAAVIVCFLIFMSMVPLVRGLTKSLQMLLSIRAEERSEAATLHSTISQ